ncbi:TPA: hypothetical protein NG558_004297 [Vibrio parahaemolyticus]|uniref:hypothetical protein n=1 Tax=Vibrio parahaemolyticus TaxID=670 RepID=UPI003296C052|nr:hypothetical protein [Vibrio parahaemolyticus]
MFNRKEVKEIILKKWIFPDFSNKLTWFIAGIGATVVLTPTPFKQLFYNWLVDTFNLNLGNHYTLAELQSNSAEYWLGFSLIFIALLHNIGYRVFIYKSDKQVQSEQKELLEVDKKLFLEFIELLPSDGLDIKLLEEHDFGNSHHGKEVKSLDKFVHTWNNSQKQFLDAELEAKRDIFITKSRHFIYTLANRSYAIGNGEIFSCIPDAYRNAWDWPKHVDDQIRELNELGTELFELHKEFVLLARRKLKC